MTNTRRNEGPQDRANDHAFALTVAKHGRRWPRWSLKAWTFYLKTYREYMEQFRADKDDELRNEIANGDF